MSIVLMAGVALVVFGLAELAWAVRARASRSLVAQGMMFAELGMLFIALGAIRAGPARTAVVAVFVLAGGISIAAQVKLMRIERKSARAVHG